MHDLVLDVEIGVYTHEKGVTQRVRFSVDVDVLPASGAVDDDIGRAFDYDTIIKGIKSIIARGHINLVETLAEEVAAHCLAHPRAACGQGEDREARQGARRGRRRDRARARGALTCRAELCARRRRSGALAAHGAA